MRPSFFGPSPPRDLIAFPKSTAPSDAPTTFARGRLTLRDGCFRIDGDEGSRLVIWPSVAAPTPDRRGARDASTGNVVTLGQTMVGSGQLLDSVDPTQYRPPIPAICAGPYWLAATGFSASPPAP